MTHAALKPEEIVAQSEAHIDDYLFRGGPDTEKEDIELGEKFGVGEVVRAAWANAKEIEEAWVDHATESPPSVEERKSSSFLPGVQPLVEKPVGEKPMEVVGPKPSPGSTLGQSKPWIRRFPKPNVGPQAKPELEQGKAIEAAIAGIKQKPSFKVTLLTADETKKRIAELAEIFEGDPSEERLRYNTRKAEIAEELAVTPMDVHRAVQKWIKDEKEEKKELTQAQKVVSLALDQKVQLWVDPSDRAAYVSVIVGKHCESYRLGDRWSEDWLRAEYGRRHWVEIESGGVMRRVPAVLSTAVLNEGLATMKAMAGNRQQIIPALRVGSVPGEVWLDLGTDDWELVRVTKNGWTIVGEGIPEVRFVRKPGMWPLPIPVKGGNIRELRGFLNTRDEEFVLDVGWLLGAMRVAGSYSPMCLCGSADAAKTTGLRVRQRLIDPSFIDVRPFKTVDDMFIAAFHCWIPAFDNISKIPEDISDAVAMIATGSGYGKRQLRTDADQFMIRVARPMLLAGIPNDLADRDDLASRTIVLELPALADEDVKFEEEFWSEFEEARPRILGALLDGVVGALRGYQQVDLGGYGRIRMAEFARWAEAGCRALGFRDGEFLDAYVKNQARAMQLAFNNDPLAQAVALLVEQCGGRWAGNTKPLYSALERAAMKGGKSDLLDAEGWPANASWLGRDLRKSAAVLRKVCGIEIKFDLDLRKTGEGDKDGLEIIKRTKPVESKPIQIVSAANKVAPIRTKVPSWRRF